MKCPKCDYEITVKIDGDYHRKFHEWKCIEHGIIKTQYVIDGEVMREWNLE